MTEASNTPHLNTLAALAIAPSGVGDELSEYVADVVKVIRDSGLRNETHSMFTEIEGDYDEVMAVVRKATMVLAEKGYRTGVTLKLDIRPGFSGQMDRKPALVDEILAKKAKNSPEK
ncbi:MAG: MTH1187 family thiamine-binding protein [Bifidobacteriaceae bacterium]|jgi:uncharacterized protein (TIGR00106 family)|nr:MTH1187 family thiamine-binding protein [Bifidobacteriaceae bacterium]